MKNYVKRIFALAIAGIMVCAALTGCSGSKETKTADSNSLTIEDGVLKVAMECGYAPYNWPQMKTVQFQLQTAQILLMVMTL